MGSITTELVETGEKRDALGRRVTSAARRAELIEEYRASGLTMAEMARREGVVYSTFAGWVLRSERAGTGRLRAVRRATPVKFTEVKLPLIAPLEVRLSDGTVLRGGDAAGLAALVRALRG